MIEIVDGWFKCEYPGCHFEGDRYYLVEHEGKEIKVCEECFKKTRGKRGISKNVHA